MPRRVNDKFTTKRVTNTPIPAWNEICDFPDVTQDSKLEFAVEGIDRDGWPKTDNILGHVELPKESIGDQGFKGELKLLDTKHTVDANLQVEIAVLALWDDDSDERVPLEATRAALQRMEDAYAKSWAAPLDLDQLEPPEENTWDEIDMGPCTVYELLYADASRRRCDKKLNDNIGIIQCTSLVKKKEWVWNEVDRFLSRVYGDKDSVRNMQDVTPEPAKARDPRPHLNCVEHPDDAGHKPYAEGADLACIRAKKTYKKKLLILIRRIRGLGT
jgi:hypothetical protein